MRKGLTRWKRILSHLSQPVAKTLGMRKRPGHSSFTSERIVLLSPFPAFLHKGSQSRPIPFPGLHSGDSICDDLTLIALIPRFPPFNWLCLQSQNILLWLWQCISLSLLCNLTSSGWFPIFVNNNGKRVLRVIIITNWIANLLLFGGKEGQ